MVTLMLKIFTYNEQLVQSLGKFGTTCIYDLKLYSILVNMRQI